MELEGKGMNEQPGREAEQYASAYSREYFQELYKRGGAVGREGSGRERARNGAERAENSLNGAG
jgi:hypothetical protein